MSNYLIQESTLDAIGDAIREKEGSSGLIPLLNMPSRIIQANQIPVNPEHPAQFTAYIIDQNGSGAYNLVASGNNYQQKSVTPTGQAIVVTADQGYDALSQVTVTGDANLVAGNIKKDVSIYGVTGTYEGGTPQSETLLWSYNGNTYTGGSTGVTIDTCRTYSKIRIDYAPSPSYENSYKYLASYFIDVGEIGYLARTTYGVTEHYNMYLTAISPIFNQTTGGTPSDIIFIARGLFFSSTDRNLYFADHCTTKLANGTISNTDTGSIIPRAIYGIS